MWEAPRGALLHTEKVENDVITHYQEIIPSTWNLSPTDGKGEPGPLEEMLVGTSVTDIDKPLTPGLVYDPETMNIVGFDGMGKESDYGETFKSDEREAVDRALGRARGRYRGRGREERFREIRGRREHAFDGAFGDGGLRGG